jgi:hypothetical protein
MSDCNLYSLPKSTEHFSKCEGQLPSKYVPDTSTVNCLGKQIMYNGRNISEGILISSWDEGEEMKISRVRHMYEYSSRCESLHFCNGSLIMKSGRGKKVCGMWLNLTRDDETRGLVICVSGWCWQDCVKKLNYRPGLSTTSLSPLVGTDVNIFR